MENYLKRFIKAQNECFEIVYYELMNGKKESDWMSFIFPQIVGLSKAESNFYYAINDLKEAKDFLNNEILGERMNILLDVILNLNTNDAKEVFGFPEHIKFWSSMTLFSVANPNNPRFKLALDKFYQGRLELATIDILKDQGE